MLTPKAVQGDYLGSVIIKIGTLWKGPEADKFKGIEFYESKAKHTPDEIVKVVKLESGESNSTGAAISKGIAGGLVFGLAGVIAGAASGGKVSVERYGIEFTNGKKVIIEQEPNDKILQCLILFAKAKGIYEEKKPDLGF